MMTFHNHQGLFFALAILCFLNSSAPLVSTKSLDIPTVSSSHNQDTWKDSYKFTTYQPGQNYEGLSNIKSHFHKLGYIPNAPASKFDDNFDDSLVSAILTYQNMYNLNPTGKLDHKTLQLLMTPRCGVPDIMNTITNTDSIHRVSHYSYPGYRWPVGTTELTYGFAPKNNLNNTFKTAFANGFVRWTPKVNIKFREESYSTSKIKVSFEDKNHGDAAPFGDTTWAHAYYPTIGKFHLNNNATWVASGDVTKRTEPRAVDLESIAVHEMGHLLGLNHSTYKSAIMYPYLPRATRKVDLTQDDIDGIQKLYKIRP